jgi:hypothetical protein
VAAGRERTRSPEIIILGSADVDSDPTDYPDYSGWTGCNDAVIAGAVNGTRWVVSLEDDEASRAVQPAEVAAVTEGKVVTWQRMLTLNPHWSPSTPHWMI